MKRFLAGLIVLVLLLSGPAVITPSYAQVPLGSTYTSKMLPLFDSDGNEVAADSTPTCDVIEEITGTPIINNANMALLAGTTNVYYNQTVASSGNGFEVGKWYNKICEATVGGLTQNIVTDHFRITPTENVTGRQVMDAGYINGVATTSVTTVSAYLGSTQPFNFTGTGASAYAKVDVIDLAGTAQTARDIGASVLLSNGTGTGQLKLASGYVAMTWADIGSPTSTVNLSGTTFKNVTDIATTLTALGLRLPAALIGGRMDSIVDAYGSGLAPLQPTVAGRTLDVTATGAAGIDWANIENPTTIVGFTNTSLNVNSGTTNFWAQAFTANSGKVYADAVAGSVVKEIADHAAGSVSTALATGTSDSGTTTTMVDAARTEGDSNYFRGEQICFTSGNINMQCRTIDSFNPGTDTMTFSPAVTQAVATQNYAIYPGNTSWDSLASSYNVALTMGNKVNTAAGAADAGSDTCPGAYGAGTLCYLIGTYLDATISSRASQTSLNTVDDYVDTEVASIQTDTTSILSKIGTPGTTLATDLNSALANTVSINAKTAQLTFTVPNQVDANSLNGGTGACPELTTVPSTTPTLCEAASLITMSIRDKIVVTSSGSTGLKKFYNDAGTVIFKKTTSKTNSSFTENEAIPGP